VGGAARSPYLVDDEVPSPDGTPPENGVLPEQVTLVGDITLHLARLR